MSRGEGERDERKEENKRKNDLLLFTNFHRPNGTHVKRDKLQRPSVNPESGRLLKSWAWCRCMNILTHVGNENSSLYSSAVKYNSIWRFHIYHHEISSQMSLFQEHQRLTD